MSNQAKAPQAGNGRTAVLTDIVSGLGKENESRAFQLLHALPAAIYTTDASGHITFYNEAAATLWGHRPISGSDEWCGSWRLYWPDGTPLPHNQCPMAIALKERRPINGMEAIAERPDGSRVPFMAFPSPLFSDTGKLVGAVNMLVDISDRKRDEEIAQRLAAIVEHSDDAIASKNLDGIVMTWNSGAQRVFGYAAEEIIGKPISILIPSDRQNEEPLILERIRKGERIDHYETVRVRKDGTLIDISLTVSPIRDGRGRVIGASKIARDISERKRQEAYIALLSREVDHRAKNLLANVQATVMLADGDTPQDVKSRICGRIQALANAHNLLASSRWEGASIESLINQELSPYFSGDVSRVSLSGRNQIVGPKASQSLAIIVHELATNAAKYGALSAPTGSIFVEWSMTGDGEFMFRWTEKGGPKITTPSREGFGTRAIRMMTRNHLNGDVNFDWRDDGLICSFKVPSAKVSLSE